MKQLLVCALSIIFGLALGLSAEAQVTLGGPLKVLDGAKTIDVPAGQVVNLEKFQYNPKGNPVGNVQFNDSGLGNAPGGNFEGTFNGKKVSVPKQTVLDVLTRQNGPTVPVANSKATAAPVPTADPKATVDRLAAMNKSTGKGPNGSPPCEACGHLAGKETDAFESITKSDEELRKYTCLFHKHTNATGVGDRNFETALPIMKEVSQVTGVPTVYMSCIIQQESQYEIFNGGGHTGLGHFGNTTAAAVAQDTLDAVREIATKRGFPNRNASQVKSMILMNDGTRLTPEIALYQTAAIAVNARRLLQEFGLGQMNAQQSAVQHDGQAFLNALLLAAAGHNVGQGVVATIPYQAFKTNSTNWTSRVSSGITRLYLQNMKACMAKGNFEARDAGAWKPDHARCGG